MAELYVRIVSAEQEIWRGQASMVTAKTVEGEIGILPGHEPMLGLLANEGTVRVTTVDGQKITAEAAEGFLSVDADQVRVVARRAALT
jgi:F-type H+-transporting ATPase subunit epsilon